MNTEKLHGCGFPFTAHIYDHGALICPTDDESKDDE